MNHEPDNPGAEGHTGAGLDPIAKPSRKLQKDVGKLPGDLQELVRPGCRSTAASSSPTPRITFPSR
jgi:hypothetical protein